MLYLIFGILNGMIGIYYIYNGMKINKKEFLKDVGYLYIFWVIGSTIFIMSYI